SRRPYPSCRRARHTAAQPYRTTRYGDATATDRPSLCRTSFHPQFHLPSPNYGRSLNQPSSKRAPEVRHIQDVRRLAPRQISTLVAAAKCLRQLPRPRITTIPGRKSIRFPRRNPMRIASLAIISSLAALAVATTPALAKNTAPAKPEDKSVSS